MLPYQWKLLNHIWNLIQWLRKSFCISFNDSLKTFLLFSYKNRSNLIVHNICYYYFVYTTFTFLNYDHDPKYYVEVIWYYYWIISYLFWYSSEKLKVFDNEISSFEQNLKMDYVFALTILSVILRSVSTNRKRAFIISKTYYHHWKFFSSKFNFLNNHTYRNLHVASPLI